MPKFKVMVPLVVEAENAEEAHVNVVSAVAGVDENEGVQFFLDAIVDTVEPLDEDEEELGGGTDEGEEEGTGDTPPAPGDEGGEE